MRGRPLRVVVVMLAALAIGFGASTHAYAAPTPEEIESQIKTEWDKLEPIIEQYNGVNSQLKANKATADALQQQLQPLELEVDVAMARVEAIAVHAYKSGNASAVNAILVSGSPDGLLDQMGRLEVLARKQRLQISDVAAVRDKYAEDKRALDDLIAQQSAQEADLAAKKKEIEAKIADLEKKLRDAYGGSVPAAGAKPANCPAEHPGGAGETAAATACAQVNKWYKYGAAGPNTFDCSGLTMYAWAAAGVSLDHNAAAQFNNTKHVGGSSLRVGDLIYFHSPPTHVAIYVGAGYMVHAPHTGARIAMVSVSGYYTTPSGYSRPS